MINFENKIVQFGFGAVGKSFFEKVSKEIKFDNNKYIVISRDRLECPFFLELGGKLENFIVADINRENYEIVFSKYLEEGDILIDFADSVGTKDFIAWCAKNNIMYLNTGETDWSDNWYNIFEENLKKNNLREEIKLNTNINKHPIVLQHGNNPGLVSHFVKAGLEYIVQTQFKNNEKYKTLLSEKKFNELAKELGLMQIHVNDNDFQVVNDKFNERKLYSSWSIDSFFFEMISNSTANIGTEEKIDYENECENIDFKNGFLEFKKYAIDKVGKTYYPKGAFEGFLVPHEETITIAKNLEVKSDNETIYRPTVMFIYSPCNFAIDYLKKARESEINNNSNTEIIRGFRYPEDTQIIYRENIKKGTEYVGVLLLGRNFKPVWIGNRIKKSFLYKNKKDSYWQTPTITPVAMSALAACCWMIKNKDKRGIFFPDDIEEYKEIIKFSEKYISKTIYKTFSRKKIEHNLKINLDSVQLKDILL